MTTGITAEWVASIGTVLAFAAVVAQMYLEWRRRIKQATQAQAEQIAAWVHEEPGNGEPKTSFAVSNASTVPVYRVIVTLVDVKGWQPGDGKKTIPQGRNFLSVVPPGTWYVAGFTHRGMSFHPGVEIAFCDAAGRNWLRTGNGKLKQIPKSPVNYYGLSLPLPWRLPSEKPEFG